MQKIVSTLIMKNPLSYYEDPLSYYEDPLVHSLISISRHAWISSCFQFCVWYYLKFNHTPYPNKFVLNRNQTKEIDASRDP